MALAFNIGQALDKIGTGLKLPEFGLSEATAGRRTKYTGVTPQSQAKGYSYDPSWGNSGMITNKNTPSYSQYSSNVYYGGVNPSTGANKINPSQGSGSSSSSSGSTGGYDASAMLKQSGIDPSQKSELFKQYGVDNTPDLLKAMEKAEAKRAQGVRDMINQRYRTFNDYYNTQSAKYPTMQQEDISNIGAQRQTLLDTAGQGRDYALGRVQSQQAEGVRDIAKSFRQGADAANMLIGAAGGGDSSAVPMASYALQKQASQARGGLQKIVMDKTAEIENAYNTEAQGVETWFQEQSNNVTEYYRSLFDRLDQLKLQADDSRLAALQSLEEQAFQGYQEKVANLEAEAMANRQNLQNWLLQRTSELNDWKLSLSQSADFDAPSMAMSEASYSVPTYGAEDYQVYAPAKKSIRDYMR